MKIEHYKYIMEVQIVLLGKTSVVCGWKETLTLVDAELYKRAPHASEEHI